MNFFKYMFLASVFINGWVHNVWGQNSPNQLSREEIVFVRDNPTVFLCVESFISDRMRLKLVNNTVWVIRLHTAKESESTHEFLTIAGTNVRPLNSGSDFAPNS